MSPNQIFSIANLIAVIAWLQLAVFPRRPKMLSLVSELAVPMLLAIAYSVIVAAHWAGSQGGFSSLPDVALLFGNPWMLLAGWLHYLAFDLLIGGWEVRDAHERGIPHALVVPCLILTFLFGPAGWLTYQFVRAMAARTTAGARSAKYAK